MHVVVGRKHCRSVTFNLTIKELQGVLAEENKSIHPSI